jgi:hypothetical protein
MRQITMTALVFLVALALTSARSVAADPKKAEAKPENKLIGTWKLLSAKYGGKEIKLPEGSTRIKHVTPVQLLWAAYDKDGKVLVGWGGAYTVKGEQYIETPEYGVGGVPDPYKGKPQEFKWKVEENKWHHTGKLSTGLTIEEVWERVEKKEEKR